MKVIIVIVSLVKMKIIEIFHSIQAEVSCFGEPAIFIRLAGCNLKCCFCDTKYSWKDGTDITIAQIIKQIKKYRCETIVITGGEPMMQQNGLIELLSQSALADYFIIIETNGTIEPIEHLRRLVNVWNISPKEPFALKNRVANVFKFVVEKQSDLNFIEKLKLPKSKIYLMPKASTRKQYLRVAPKVWKLCLKYGYKFAAREQIVLFDKKRGV